MLTEGIISSIDYVNNECKVRLPILETCSQQTDVVLPAIFCDTPGLTRGYKVGDVVCVTFEDNSINKPIILGKIVKDLNEINEISNLTCGSFTCSGDVSLPLNTTFVDENAFDGHNYTVKELLTLINDLKMRVGALENPSTDVDQVDFDVIDVDGGFEPKSNILVEGEGIKSGTTLNDTVVFE